MHYLSEVIMHIAGSDIGVISSPIQTVDEKTIFIVQMNMYSLFEFDGNSQEHYFIGESHCKMKDIKTLFKRSKAVKQGWPYNGTTEGEIIVRQRGQRLLQRTERGKKKTLFSEFVFLVRI